MTPTLLDVAYIAGLPVVGNEPTLINSDVPKDSTILMGVDISSNAWGKYIQNNMSSTLGDDEEPTVEEHTAFLLAFINRYARDLS